MQGTGTAIATGVLGPLEHRRWLVGAQRRERGLFEVYVFRSAPIIIYSCVSVSIDGDVGSTS